MPSQTEQEVAEIVERAVRRSTGLHALREIRKLVDATIEEERAKSKLAKRIVLCFALVVVAIFIWSTISTSLKKSAENEYIHSIVNRIERSANSNYPKELKDNSVYGTAVLHLSVTSDGQLTKVEIHKSSGNSLLDNVAVRLVENAQPFPSAPEALRKQVDIFEITRAFSFTHESVTKTP